MAGVRGGSFGDVTGATRWLSSASRSTTGQVIGPPIICSRATRGTRSKRPTWITGSPSRPAGGGELASEFVCAGPADPQHLDRFLDRQQTRHGHRNIVHRHLTSCPPRPACVTDPPTNGQRAGKRGNNRPHDHCRSDSRPPDIERSSLWSHRSVFDRVDEGEFGPGVEGLGGGEFPRRARRWRGCVWALRAGRGARGARRRRLRDRLGLRNASRSRVRASSSARA